MSEWVRFGITAALIIAGLLMILFSILGVYRFRYVLNRMHAAALGDSLGITLVIAGLIVANGFSPVTWKLILVLIFFWIASPVSSHLLSRLEVTTNEKLSENVTIREDKH